MSYSVVTDPAVLAIFTVEDPQTGEAVSVIAPDEQLLQLDTGEFVAASSSAYRDEFTNGRTLQAIVRWLGEDGSLQVDAFGRPVLTVFPHGASAGQIAQYTEPALRKELLLMMLGEPPSLVGGEPLIVWPDEIRACVSIRSAIAAASSEGPAYDLETLL